MPRPELTPAEIMAILPATADQIADIASGLSSEELNAQPTPGDWSINYILAHLRSSEVVLGGQMMRIVAEDHPSWKRLSPREYIRRTDFPGWQFEPALEAFRAHRAQLLDVLTPLPEQGWLRTALVTDSPGKVVDHTLRFYGNWLADHERGHVDQIREIAATCR